MSSKLYAQPLRVYVLLGALALVGIYSGLNLPVSLFPNSAKPEVYVGVGYGSSTAAEFVDAYGYDFEQALRNISTKDAKVESVEATYWAGEASYLVVFAWGSDPETAQRETSAVANAWTPRFPLEVQDTVYAWMNNENSGFFAASFYSEKRSLDEVYDLLSAALRARLAAIEDADDPELWNPSRKEIRVELKPEAMASLQLLPRDVERAVNGVLSSRQGGSVTVGTNRLRIEMPRLAESPDDLAEIPILTPTGKVVHLADIALVDFGVKSTDSRLIKTSGASSVMIFATPKPGGNVKKMSEDLIAAIEAGAKTLPPDIKYKVLVDPSHFIRSAVRNVFHEVLIGALLAVSVLFVFIGSFKNVVTAAIEIPLSIILAFILMKMTGVNINLISLGGLALSAGMNVDGSVVVMENIFRHFDLVKGKTMNAREKLHVIVTAVNEVKLPLVASTIASLVVFLPLALTSALSYAILGDLAMAVVFSHGFSAIVALILVPTIRLHLMKKERTHVPHKSPFERGLGRIESLYATLLALFLGSRVLQLASYAGLAAVLAVLVTVVLPKLPREVIGTPDSDMVFVSLNTQGNTMVRQMETQSDEVERDLLAEFGDRIDYTFTQIRNPNRASILARLKDKGDMEEVWAALEKRFTNSPTMRFHIEPWNPSELPIPDPVDLRVAVRGGDLSLRRDLALELSDLLETNQVFSRVQTHPNVERSQGVSLQLDPEQWAAIAREGHRLTPSDLADISRVATTGRRIAKMTVKDRETEVILRYPHEYVATPDDLQGLPIGLAGKIVPLKSLLPFKLVETAPPVHRENSQDLFLVFGRQNKSEKAAAPAAVEKAKALIADWQAKKDAAAEAAGAAGVVRPVVVIEDAGKDITQAIEQLGMAIAISIVLIFLVLLLQFGSIVESLLVLVAVPLGFIGVILALFATGSSLSLNSALGVILLNGIAVNNSIIMVDFIRRLSESGLSPTEAATEAARKRLRPILITSLTTILGMMPIALGFGEGGKILQPLGIAVSGGLWISMGLTLFLVPALHVSYLRWRAGRTVSDHEEEGVMFGGLEPEGQTKAVAP